VIPLSSSLDHVGFFTGDVEGAQLAASILCQGWKHGSELSRPVLGIPEGPYLEKASDEALSHFRRTCSKLSEAGFEISSVHMFEDFEAIVERHETLEAAEAAQVHRTWFDTYSELYHHKTAVLIRKGQKVPVDLVEDYRGGREELREEIMEIMDRNGLSAFLAPAAVGSAPSGLESTGDPVMNLPWTHAGLPAISLPSGMNSEGLPLGLQVVGRWMDDEGLLGWAGRVEGFIGS
jgi:Asp-tRNA(Asn)/Glu-tRNA(Gln) amidotransferase A subunit family amidase